MGEMADMMLEGAMCQGCGEYLGDGDGYPTYCAACSSEGARPRKSAPTTAKTRCGVCNKLVTVQGLADHTRMKHGGANDR